MLAQSVYNPSLNYINSKVPKRVYRAPEVFFCLNEYLGDSVVRYAENVIFLGRLVSLRFADRKLHELGYGGSRQYLYLLKRGLRQSLNLYSVSAWSIVFGLPVYGVLLNRDCKKLYELGALRGVKNDKIYICEGWTVDKSGNFFKDGVLCNGD